MAASNFHPFRATPSLSMVNTHPAARSNLLGGDYRPGYSVEIERNSSYLDTSPVLSLLEQCTVFARNVHGARLDAF